MSLTDEERMMKKRICNFQVVDDRRLIAIGPRHDVVDCRLTSLSSHPCDFEDCIIYKIFCLLSKGEGKK